MPPLGLDNLKHLVVLMMENRSFDHMLGSLGAVNPNIEVFPNNFSNPDTAGNEVKPHEHNFDHLGTPDPGSLSASAPLSRVVRQLHRTGVATPGGWDTFAYSY